MDILKQQLKRKASLIRLDETVSFADVYASYFGVVRLAATNEGWPIHNGKPMTPLCQINCLELPFRPDSLADIALITTFIAADELPLDSPNGDGWALRVYKELNSLIQIEAPRYSDPVKPYPIRWEVTEYDYPCLDDVTIALPAEVEENYDELFINQNGSKVGGWPSLIQSEIYWAPWNKHDAKPEYVFQIDSEEKANWQWGDAGVGYFGRGTTRDEWAFTWQCY